MVKCWKNNPQLQEANESLYTYKVIKILWTAATRVNSRLAVAKSLKVLGQAATATYEHSNVTEGAFPRNQAFTFRKY